MKKALFVSTRNPFSKRYSGDIIGSKGVIKNLKRIYSLDIVSLGNNEDLSKKNIFIFKSPSFFFKILKRRLTQKSDPIAHHQHQLVDYTFMKSSINNLRKLIF